MHLFYYQQHLQSDDVDPSLRGGGTGPPLSPVERLLGEALPNSERELAAKESDLRLHAAKLAVRSFEDLQARHGELEWRLESGALRAENENLEGLVVQMQEDFFTLQTSFREEKSRYEERLSALGRDLEAQRSNTATAERRAICTEDLVRFYEEQRRLMAAHWKGQCQIKDERIRSLNLQLTDYTADWQQVSGGQRQATGANLSHELRCLQDRHSELQQEKTASAICAEQLQMRLAENRSQADELRESEARAEASAEAHHAHNLDLMPMRRLEATNAAQRGRSRLLETWQRRHSETAAASAGPLPPPWPHAACIWRDELDVREGQLEKITAQLARTNTALDAAQAALERQRAKHEETKRRHRDAETSLRDAEVRRDDRQKQCHEVRRVVAELRGAEAAVGSALTAGSLSPANDPVRTAGC